MGTTTTTRDRNEFVLDASIPAQPPMPSAAGPIDTAQPPTYDVQKRAKQTLTELGYMSDQPEPIGEPAARAPPVQTNIEAVGTPKLFGPDRQPKAPGEQIPQDDEAVISKVTTPPSKAMLKIEGLAPYTRLPVSGLTTEVTAMEPQQPKPFQKTATKPLPKKASDKVRSPSRPPPGVEPAPKTSKSGAASSSAEGGPQPAPRHPDYDWPSFLQHDQRDELLD